MTTQSNLPDLITRQRTACAPESPLGKLFSEAADTLTAEREARIKAEGEQV